MRYPNCAAALAALASNDPGICDFEGGHQAAMCSAWHSTPHGEQFTFDAFGKSIEQGWQRVHASCQNAATMPIPRRPTITWGVTDRGGAVVGTLNIGSDGSITSCIHGDCSTLPAGTVQEPAEMADFLEALLPVVGYGLKQNAAPSPAGGECGLCTASVDFLCSTYRGDFCDLRDRYYAERLPSDETYYQAMKMATPEQQEALRQHLRTLSPA